MMSYEYLSVRLYLSLPSLLCPTDYHRQQTRQEEAELDRSALIGSLTHHYRCPRCANMMEGRIYQCSDGHIYCEECQQTEQTCGEPDCKKEAGGRNFAMERIFQLITDRQGQPRPSAPSTEENILLAACISDSSA